MPETITAIELEENEIEITYADGSEEEIEDGIYTLKDAMGQIVEERTATAEDIARLEDLVANADPALIKTEDEDDDSDEDEDEDDEDEDEDEDDEDEDDDDDDDDVDDEDDESDDDDAELDLDEEDDAYIAESVALLYTECFHRAPDAAGLNFWIDAHEDGLDMVEMAAMFVDSIEFQDSIGDSSTMDNRAFVEALYGEMLERPGDDDGIAFWTEVLDGGFDRAQCVLDFAISQENRETTPELDMLVEIAPGEWDMVG